MVVRCFVHTHTCTHARTQLVYCMAHFHGDEKVTQYIHHLIDPSEDTEPGSEQGPRPGEDLFGFTEDDYLALLMKNPETLFQDDSYMKHLRRHSTRYVSRDLWRHSPRYVSCDIRRHSTRYVSRDLRRHSPRYVSCDIHETPTETLHQVRIT